MLRRLGLACALACALGSTAYAQRQWKAIEIAGAQCGDGSAYKVMVSDGDRARIAFDLMGGGACWSFDTCFGPDPHAWIHPIPKVFETDGFVSDDVSESPAATYSMVFFPYCTGDVHAGDHDGHYGPFTVHHWGKRNFELAVNQLQRDGVIDLRQARDFILYGYSAGAIGALFHLQTLEPLLERAQTKTLLADAPGLHFGKNFWEKFSPEFLKEFEAGLSRAGIPLKRSNGNIAGVIPALCRLAPDWRVGVLQGSRDLIMSSLFGGLSPDEHEKMIYSSEGLYGLTLDPTDNCSAWVPSTSMHTFLVTSRTASMKASEKSAMDFAFDTVLRLDSRNYR